MTNPLVIFRGVQKAEEVVRGVKAAKTVAKATTEVIVPHPLNTAENFTFPAGTDPKVAKEFVRKMLLVKARQGEAKITLPSELTADRVSELKKKETELEHMIQVVKDLEKKKDLNKVGPGVYQNQDTGDYWRVLPDGRIQKFDFTTPKE